jgi:hypothetical protein
VGRDGTDDHKLALGGPSVDVCKWPESGPSGNHPLGHAEDGHGFCILHSHLTLAKTALRTGSFCAVPCDGIEVNQAEPSCRENK